jgi:hypothetical protein
MTEQDYVAEIARLDGAVKERDDKIAGLQTMYRLMLAQMKEMCDDFDRLADREDAQTERIESVYDDAAYFESVARVYQTRLQIIGIDVDRLLTNNGLVPWDPKRSIVQTVFLQPEPCVEKRTDIYEDRK